MQTDYLKNHDINSREVRNKIFKYLYSHNIKPDTKYHQISSEADLDYIKDSDYIICPRFTGVRTWIVFFSTGINYYAVNFPKHSQHKQDEVQIFQFEPIVNKAMYQGTIMEGIYFKFEDKKVIVVDDVYLLAGDPQMLKTKDARLKMLSEYFKSNISMIPKFGIYLQIFIKRVK
jgi:hypothetical protein